MFARRCQNLGGPSVTDDGDTAAIGTTWAADEDPTSVVVETVAAETARDPPESQPLYDYVEADVLDRMLRAARANDQTVTVSFDYDGATVTVTSEGRIEVTVTDAEWA